MCVMCARCQRAERLCVQTPLTVQPLGASMVCRIPVTSCMLTSGMRLSACGSAHEANAAARGGNQNFCFAGTALCRKGAAARDISRFAGAVELRNV